MKNCPTDSKHLIDGMKSFLSGHSSFSYYCSVFLALYLQFKLNMFNLSSNTEAVFMRKELKWPRIALKGLKILRPYIQISLLAFAAYIGFTRISDYMHHPTDVITGALVGTIIAIFNILIIINLPFRPRIFHVTKFVEPNNSGTTTRDPEHIPLSHLNTVKSVK